MIKVLKRWHYGQWDCACYIDSRWNRKKGCWYAKQSEETISFALELFKNGV